MTARTPVREDRPAASGAMVEAVNVTRTFGALTAVRNLTLSIARGEMFALIGPDGAGKTTFFRMMAGVLAPTSGTLTRHASMFGLVPQRFGLYQDLSIDENLRLRARLYDVPPDVARQRADELLGLVGLEPFRARLAGALSGGMKQKLALASALLTRPELLLLDEPTTGVDPLSRREFWKMLHQLHHQGLTIIVSTPYMDEAEYASRLAFMHNGEIVETGSRAEIVAAYGRQLVEVHVADRDRLKARVALQALPGVDDASLFGTALHARGEAGLAPGLTSRVEAALAGGFADARVTAIAPTLEDVFVLRSESHA